MENPHSFVAECYWPDVREKDVLEVDARIGACLVDGVRLIGSMLIRDDEVVLFQLEGAADSVRTVLEAAHVPFARLLETHLSQSVEQRSTDA